MVIRLDENYNAMTSTALLGYVGETNARPVSVEGLTVDGADHYVLTIDYGDGTVYEVDITGGTWTPTADILRSAQTVSCQICAKKLSGQEYILLKKSRIFRLRIGAAIGDNAVPSPDVAMDALDRIDAIGRQAHADRKAAETAAQTAQAVADSLPDDYTTAVKKIAENTAEISAVKLTDKELQRRVNALYDLGNGITHKFETDTDTAYAKTVPTGAKLMSIKSVGGRSIVFNQVVNPNNFRPNYTVNGVTFTKLDNYKFVANGTATGGDAYFSDSFVPIKGHVYLEKSCPKGGSAETYRSYITGSGVVMDTNYGSGVIAPLNVDARVYIVPLMVKSGATVNNLVIYPQIYDLTAMFGAGNEPSTVEEFEKMFPADYYPYNAGEIVSAGTEEIVEQGRNLWDEVWGVGSINSSSGNNEFSKEAIYSKTYTPIAPDSIHIFVYAGSAKFENVKTRFYDYNKNYIGYNDKDGQTVYPNKKFITPSDAFYVRFTLPPDYGNVYKNDIALIADSSGAYAPFHRNVYQIPEAIRNLPGYGVEGNTVDYEAKTYTQNNTIDGTEVKALDTPIVTDISDLIPDDFLRNIEVEAGGSVTFKNSNDSYRIPVPNEEEYVVKLSEIGGSV